MAIFKGRDTSFDTSFSCTNNALGQQERLYRQAQLDEEQRRLEEDLIRQGVEEGVVVIGNFNKVQHRTPVSLAVLRAARGLFHLTSEAAQAEASPDPVLPYIEPSVDQRIQDYLNAPRTSDPSPDEFHLLDDVR